MGQVLHGCATTTHAVRAALQRSKAPLKDLAAQHGLNLKTVAKWRKRAFVHDAAMGPKTPRSTVLTTEEEAVIVAYPPAHPPAARRLPLRAPGHDPAPNPLVAASLSTAPRDQPVTRGRRRQARQASLQGLSDRLLPYRHRRGSHRRRQAVPLGGHRQDIQIRLRPAARTR